MAAWGDAGCAACGGRRHAAGIPMRERCVRGGLAALATAFVGGWIAAQYVDTQYFSLLAPALVALGCAWAASAAARTTARWTLLVGVVTGVLATALSDRLVPGGQNLFLPPGHRLPPYVAAAVGALAWPLLFGPPRARRERQPDGRGIRRK